MDMKRSAQIAVVTNLAPNHLDVHKDMAEYVEAKRNICNFQGAGDILVVNLDNEIANSFKTAGSLRQFSRQSRPENGIFLENGMIYRKHGEQIEAVLAQKDILLPGIHNVENYMAALCATYGMVDRETFCQVARDFAGVAHRLELIRELRGVKYINDSIASSPTRAIAGLRSFKPTDRLVLIVGGHDKNMNWAMKFANGAKPCSSAAKQRRKFPPLCGIPSIIPRNFPCSSTGTGRKMFWQPAALRNRGTRSF